MLENVLNVPLSFDIKKEKELDAGLLNKWLHQKFDFTLNEREGFWKEISRGYHSRKIDHDVQRMLENLQGFEAFFANINFSIGFANHWQKNDIKFNTCELIAFAVYWRCT